MTPDEEAAYVREVAEAKTAALRMSLDPVERQGMPFVGEEPRDRAGRGWARCRRPSIVTSDASTPAVGSGGPCPPPTRSASSTSS